MNFIFDLGGVVVTWEPDKLIAQHFTDPVLQSRVKSQFVGHADWIELDRGTLPRQTAIERAAQRIGVTEAEIAGLLNSVPAALVAMPGTVAMLYRLKAQGHSLYCLSNMHREFIDYLEKTYDFWPVFNGVVVSCRVQLCKPEPATFEYILGKYALDPGATLFIDDMAVNLSAAATLGIQTLQFQNPAQCGAGLKTLGYLD
ncbi:MAG: HAD family phosphatase [Methylococcales bacterium]